MSTIPVLSIRKKDLPAAIGLSKTTIDSMRREGKFPMPRQIGKQSIGWPVDELKAWLKSCPQVNTETHDDDDEPDI